MMGHCLAKACSLQNFGRGQMSMLRYVWTNCSLNTFEKVQTLYSSHLQFISCKHFNMQRTV